MLREKLRSRKGESLIEILAAIVVCGLSIMLLVGMVTTAMRVNRQARSLDGSDGAGGFYGALSEVETHSFSSADKTLSVKAVVSGDDTKTISFSNVYSYTKGEPFALTAYGKGAGG